MTRSSGGEWFITGLFRFFAGLVSIGVLAFVIGYLLRVAYCWRNHGRH